MSPTTGVIAKPVPVLMVRQSGRATFDMTVGSRPTSSSASLEARQPRAPLSLTASTLPPGKAIWPGCCASRATTVWSAPRCPCLHRSMIWNENPRRAKLASPHAHRGWASGQSPRSRSLGTRLSRGAGDPAGHSSVASKPSVAGVELVMRAAELAIGGHGAVFRGHVRNVFGRIDRQRLPHPVRRTGAAELTAEASKTRGASS